MRKVKIALFAYFLHFLTHFDNLCKKIVIESIKAKEKSLNYQRWKSNKELGEKMDISQNKLKNINKYTKHTINHL